MSHRVGHALRWYLARAAREPAHPQVEEPRNKTPTVEFTRRLAPLAAPLLTALLLMLPACDRPSPLTGPEGPNADSPEAPSLAVAYPGGIPIGLFALPTSQYGSLYDGAVRNARIIVEKSNLLTELAAIKAKGGKVILAFAGNERYYRDSYGHFSMTKWKDRMNMFKPINFTSYVTDGTIIGHFLIDEPSDPNNWGGQVIPQSSVEAMAKYSKSIWPSLPTIVRAEASWLAGWTGTYQYLDGAWAQWVTRKGDPLDFVNRNIADAKKKGLALVVGLNISRGNNGSKMSASMIKSAGGTLLSSTYPCAFMSWEWDAAYLTTTTIKDAMLYLRSKAQNRSFKSCRGT
jgi:hypothetical protein